MKIEITPKLDFNNVLIKPQRTTISSRNEVCLERIFTFQNSSSSWKGVPIMAANMDTTGTFEVLKILSKFKILTCLNKFYNLKDFKSFIKGFKLNEEIGDMLKYTVVSTGIRQICTIIHQ